MKCLEKYWFQEFQLTLDSENFNYLQITSGLIAGFRRISNAYLQVVTSKNFRYFNLLQNTLVKAVARGRGEQGWSPPHQKFLKDTYFSECSECAAAPPYPKLFSGNDQISFQGELRHDVFPIQWSPLYRNFNIFIGRENLEQCYSLSVSRYLYTSVRCK